MSRWQDPQLPSVAFPPFVGVTRRLILVNVAIFLVTFFLKLIPATEDFYRSLVEHFALVPGDWTASFPLVPAWQLLTYGFLHSPVELGHILLNMLTLYFFGTLLEEALGGRRYLLAYLSAQVVGAFFFLGGAWLGLPSGSAAFGASGAVYGVLMAAATLYPHRRILFLFIPLTLRTLALIFVGLTVFQALLSLRQPDGTAHLVHLGGLVYGYLAVKRRWLFVDPVEKVRVRRAVAEVERRQSDDARMDELLAKIHRDGMGSLTPGERDFLRRVSSRK